MLIVNIIFQDLTNVGIATKVTSRKVIAPSTRDLIQVGLKCSSTILQVNANYNFILIFLGEKGLNCSVCFKTFNTTSTFNFHTERCTKISESLIVS